MRHLTTTLPLLALTFGVMAAGCGSSSSDDAAKFVGTWTFDSGSVAATCPAPLPSLSVPLMSLTETITRTDATHVKLEAGGASCAITFMVSGMTATAAAGQTCVLNTPTLPVPTVSVVISTWTLMLSGTALSQSIAGTALGACATAGSGSATQHPATDGGAG
jgi:hypothetical protein